MSRKSKELLTKTHLYIISFLLCICVGFIVRYEYFIPRGPYILCRTNNDIWLAGIRNDLVSEQVAMNSFWEKDVTDFFVQNVKSSETIIEIGANIGYYTTLLSKLVGKNGHVFSYEANDEVYKMAKLSLEFNRLEGNITLKNVAVADHDGSVEFVSDSINGVKFSIINIGEGHIKRGFDLFATKKVRCVTLDNDLSDLKNVDWLRMDIEGSEILALSGAKRIIENSPKMKIVMEWDTSMMKKYGNVEQLIDQMHGYGFKFFRIPSGKSASPITKEELLSSSEPQNVFLTR